MKKKLIFFIIQLAFTNVSYASFPISDTLEVQQDIMQPEESNGNWYALLSILSALGAIIFAFLTMGSAFNHNAKYLSVITYLLLTLLSIGGTFFSALKAKKSGASWSKALLGVGIVVLVASLFFIGM